MGALICEYVCVGKEAVLCFGGSLWENSENFGIVLWGPRKNWRENLGSQCFWSWKVDYKQWTRKIAGSSLRRSYPKVRGGGRECQAVTAQEQP